MGRISKKRLEQAARFCIEREAREVAEAATAARTMTHTGLDDDHLAALGVLAGKYDCSVAELCTRMIIEWLESSD